MKRRRFVLALVTTLVTFALIDLSLTLFVFDQGRLGDRPLPPFGATPHPRQVAWIERLENELTTGVQRQGAGIFDEELGWTNTPFAPERTDALCFSSSGARGRREYSARIPEGVQRVLTFGDSFTYCAEVGDEDAWQHQLEQQRPDLEVLNFGVGGYGTDQALLRFRRVAPAFEKDAVLMGINVENIGRNVNRYRPLYHPRTASAVAKPRFVLTQGELELVPAPFASREELLRLVKTGEVLERLQQHEHWLEPETPLAMSGFGRLFLGWRAYSERQPETLWRESEAEPFLVTLALLEAFHREALAGGAEFAGVVISQRETDLRGPRFWSPLCEELDRRGIPWLDLYEVLEPAYSRREYLFQGGHLSRRGNELSARAIESFLASAFDPQRKQPHTPLVKDLELVAHRGYAGKFPENTLAAVRGALEVDARWIEIDVQLSRDGEVVLFHDRTLDRACGVPGAVHEHDASELSSFRVRESDRLGDRFNDEPICTLSEVAALLEPHPDVTLFVEVKRVAIENHGLDKVLQEVLSAVDPIREQTVLISFSMELLEAAKGQLPLAFILDSWEDGTRADLEALAPEFVFCNYTKIPADAGLGAPWRWVLYEIVDPEIARGYASRGIDLIETFEFEAMRDALGVTGR